MPLRYGVRNPHKGRCILPELLLWEWVHQHAGQNDDEYAMGKSVTSNIYICFGLAKAALMAIASLLLYWSMYF